jgi:hypothetical protein
MNYVGDVSAAEAETAKKRIMAVRIAFMAFVTG